VCLDLDAGPRLDPPCSSHKIEIDFEVIYDKHGELVTNTPLERAVVGLRLRGSSHSSDINRHTPTILPNRSGGAQTEPETVAV